MEIVGKSFDSSSLSILVPKMHGFLHMNSNEMDETLRQDLTSNSPSSSFQEMKNDAGA
ncbi:unnamed protein product [Dovyalis caffra]|uniref:Uncharacterized protein n=1 Tax=Dovyalis caffra TaxID=77055 RepID=A0AAV1R540_9ROSI|nr:unnamed protein product [Dovyalis caffra]